MENLKEKIFPLTLIILDACASVPYFAAGDFKKGIYWIAAAVLNICVTFQISIILITLYKYKKFLGAIAPIET